MKICVLTGAGVSAESGLSTYRDSGGTWDNYDPMVVASIQGWHSDPETVLSFYNGLRKRMAACKPNSAHLDIAALEKEHEVVVITQNVDDLHERAGSSHIIHLHGEATKIRPEDCFNEYDRFSEKKVKDIGYSEVKIGDKDGRGVQYRPHIVFFGEAVPKMDEAIKAVEEADVLLIVGTSLQVYPAASLYHYARYDAPVFIVDPADVPVPQRVVHIREKATNGLKTFISALKKLQ